MSAFILWLRTTVKRENMWLAVKSTTKPPQEKKGRDSETPQNNLSLFFRLGKKIVWTRVTFPALHVIRLH